MKRRSFLTACGVAALGGCTFGTDDETPTETATPVPTTESSPTTTPTTDADERSLEERLGAANVAVDFETADLTAAVPMGPSGDRTPDGLVTRYALVEPATPDSPAVVWATVRNVRDYEQTVRTDRLGPFAPGGSYGSLAPTEDHDLLGYSVAVTRDDDGRWRLGVESDQWLPGKLTLAPQETVFGAYHLVGGHGPEGTPIEAGRYDWGTEVAGFALAVWPTSAPGPSDESVFQNPGVPALPVEGPTEWFHEADAETRVYLAPSVERVSTPARVEYELQNRSKSSLDGKSDNWGLYKLESGVWHYVYPLGYPHPPAGLQPGETDSWRLGLYNGEAVPCDDYEAVGHLGGGRYAFHVGYSYEGEVHGALLELAAPPVSPEPTEAVDIERDGGEATVTTPRWDGGDGQHDDRYVLERVETAPDRRLIPEQLYRPRFLGYRNSLPLFEEGVDRVVLRVAGDDAAGYGRLQNADPKTVAYRDETVRVEWDGAPQG